MAPDEHKRHALAGIPTGCAVKAGRFDHLSHRVDIAADGHPVIDWRPEQPSPDHEWDGAAKRWNLSAAAADRQQRHADALARIAALEAAQARPLRELALTPGDPTALGRLREIEAEIASLRCRNPIEITPS